MSDYDALETLLTPGGHRCSPPPSRGTAGHPNESKQPAEADAFSWAVRLLLDEGSIGTTAGGT